MEKKIYVEPSVKKVEFEFNERIAASGCNDGAMGSSCETISNM